MVSDLIIANMLSTVLISYLGIQLVSLIVSVIGLLMHIPIIDVVVVLLFPTTT